MYTQKEQDARMAQALCNVASAQGNLNYAMQDALDFSLPDYPGLIENVKQSILQYKMALGQLEYVETGEEI